MSVARSVDSPRVEPRQTARGRGWRPGTPTKPGRASTPWSRRPAETNDGVGRGDARARASSGVRHAKSISARGSSFYRLEYTFGDVPAPARTRPGSVSILVGDVHGTIGIADGKLGAIEPVSAVHLGWNPSRLPFRRRRDRSGVRDIVRFGTDGTVQPVAVDVDAGSRSRRLRADPHSLSKPVVDQPRAPSRARHPDTSGCLLIGHLLKYLFDMNEN